VDIHNRPALNREKLTPPSWPQNVRTGSTPPPLSVQTHHNFEKFEVFSTIKCGRLHLKTPPPPSANADVFITALRGSCPYTI